MGTGYTLQATGTGLNPATTNPFNVASWTPLNPTNPSTGPADTQALMLLPDGTVMVQGGAGSGNQHLVSVKTRSYRELCHGHMVPPAVHERAAPVFPSNVLPNGQVLVLGGEFSNDSDPNLINGMDTPTGEIYNPQASPSMEPMDTHYQIPSKRIW